MYNDIVYTYYIWTVQKLKITDTITHTVKCSLVFIIEWLSFHNIMFGNLTCIDLDTESGLDSIKVSDALLFLAALFWYMNSIY